MIIYHYVKLKQIKGPDVPRKFLGIQAESIVHGIIGRGQFLIHFPGNRKAPFGINWGTHFNTLLGRDTIAIKRDHETNVTIETYPQFFPCDLLLLRNAVIIIYTKKKWPTATSCFCCNTANSNVKLIFNG